jgi:hypothetical protein
MANPSLDGRSLCQKLDCRGVSYTLVSTPEPRYYPSGPGEFESACDDERLRLVPHLKDLLVRSLHDNPVARLILMNLGLPTRSCMAGNKLSTLAI